MNDINKTIESISKTWKSVSFEGRYSGSKSTKIPYIYCKFSLVCPPAKMAVKNRGRAYTLLLNAGKMKYWGKNKRQKSYYQNDPEKGKPGRKCWIERGVYSCSVAAKTRLYYIYKSAKVNGGILEKS